MFLFIFRSFARKKESGGGGIDSITISANQGMMQDKKKKMKKKKPSNVHIHQQQKPEMMEMEKGQEKNKETDGVKLQENAATLQQFGTVNQKSGLLGGMTLDQELVGPGKTRVKREGEQEDKEVGG